MNPSNKKLVLLSLLIPLSLFWAPSLLHAAEAAHALGFEDLVACQRAIEEVYWGHRAWPAQNEQTKPPLSDVLADSVLRAKVGDAVRKSNALSSLWQRPISAAQLDAEAVHMAGNTKNPAMLRELFAALDHNPQLVRECLARPLLADRLIRNWFAFDARVHGSLRARVTEDLERFATADSMPLMSGRYSEVSWTRTEQTEPPMVGIGELAPEASLGPEEWEHSVARLGDLLGHSVVGTTASDRLPLARLSALKEDKRRFYVVALLERASDRVRFAMVEWPKTSFDEWWSEARATLPETIQEAPSGSPLPEVAAEDCVDDNWSPLRLVPNGRANHVAVWTGSEMVIWGNRDVFGANEPGGRYDPALDVWNAISTTGQPEGNMASTGIWTGQEVVIWGGFQGTGSLTAVNTGARYDPTTDSWTPTSVLGAVPDIRGLHTTAWTGSEMIVWGGCGTTNCSTLLDTGGRWDASTDSWLPTETAGAPEARVLHTAVSSGDEMMIFGGCPEPGCFQRIESGGGARYDLATDTWAPMSTADVPSARYQHSAIWTGAEMIVHGGCVDDECSFQTTSGGRYDPVTDAWVATNTVGAPYRASHTAIWTGSEMIVWAGCSGGECQTEHASGGRYDPQTDSWVATSVETAPIARINHSAVWTGAEMMLWGGAGASGDGALYDPATDHWRSVNRFGGTGRDRPTAIWTGTEVLIWGGSREAVGASNSGERYDIISDSWTDMSEVDAPEARMNQSGVWSGSEMLVWGGCGFGGVCQTPYFNTGGRYSPGTDSWLPMSTVGAPAGRIATSSATEPLAVWSGDEMIVWGGWPSSADQTATGGRYSPATDTWSPTAQSGAPLARRHHTMVWSGDEMIVWGGENTSVGPLADGARYDPSTNSWTPTGGTSAPTARYRHTAVWTGSEMIVWGGTEDSLGSDFNSGGRYDPVGDSWTATSTGAFVPPPRYLQTAIWTGTEMIVWGGLWQVSGQTDTGGLYCAAGGITDICQDVARPLKARCDFNLNDKLQAIVGFVDGSHDGESFEFVVDDEPLVATVSGGRVRFSIREMAGTGQHTISACGVTKVITCN